MVRGLCKTRTDNASKLPTQAASRWLVGVMCALCGAGAENNAQADPAREPTPHEFFATGSANYTLDQPQDAESAASGVSLGGIQLPAPALSSANNGDEMTMGANGPETAGGEPLASPNGQFNQGIGELGLDDDTRKEGMLQYSMVFNPSVVPFKRGGVLDLVRYRGGQYKMGVRNQDLTPLPVAGSAPPPIPGFDRFWGSLHLKVERGKPVSIPSVAAEATILEYRSEPLTSVQFFVDGAGNHFVKADHTGELRLNFLTEAPATYFGAHVIPGDRLQDIPLSLRPPKLPKPVTKVAAQVVTAIGITDDMDLGEQVAQMVAYYRGFSAEPLDPAARTNDEYRDISLSRRGVCRHRAFSFVITAQHLGIPARYVFNEAHAFVEVYVPSVGWMRVDLGGSAEGLEISNTDQKVRHDPTVPDPFPKPATSDPAGGGPGNGAATGPGNGPGNGSNPNGAPSQNPSATNPSTTNPHQQNPSTQQNPQPSSEIGGGFDRVTNLPQTASELQSLAAASHVPPRSAPPPHTSTLRPSPDISRALQSLANPSAPDVPPPSDDPTQQNPHQTPHQENPNGVTSGHRLATHLMLLDAPTRALRGDTLTLHGQLFADDPQHAGLSGQKIAVVLVGRDGSQEPLQLYEGQTGPDGIFEAAFKLPPTLSLGAWDLLVVFPGNDQYRSTRSD